MSENSPIALSSLDDSSQMQSKPHMIFFGDNSFVHPTQEDAATTVAPLAGSQQVHRMMDSHNHRPTHGRSYSDAQVVLKRSVSSSSSTRLSERPPSCLGQCDTKTTAINPSVVKVPLSHYKTEFCTKFREFGECPFGARCQFVHHENELQRRGRALTYKTRPCWSGSSCQYQQKNSRCVYLHGDETAEMFDEQRGICFAKVQKILAAKEVKQQLRRQQQSSPAELVKGIPSQVGGQEMGNNRWAEESKGAKVYESTNTSAATPAIRQQKTLQRSLTYPRSTPNRKPLAIVPPSRPPLRNNKSNNENVVSTGAMATTHPLADLFSPGVMPVIETPFPSHDRIHEWKDPCFEDEDSEDSWVDIVGTVIRGASINIVLVHDGALWDDGLFSDAFPTDLLVSTANHLQSHEQGVGLQQSEHQFSLLRRTSQNALDTVFKPDNKDKVRASSYTFDISVSTSISSGNSASSPLLYSSTGRSWSPSSQLYDEESAELSGLSTDRSRKQKSWKRGWMTGWSGQHRVTSDHVRMLRVVWFLMLVFGEYAVFWIYLCRCGWPEKASWDNREVAIQERYRVVIIADPQLTDWYSYKQTGLALWLTEFYTDLYMRKSFARLHRRLQPDMVLFLGDLLDGGRETVAMEGVDDKEEKGRVYEKNKGRFMEKVFDSRRTAWNQEPLIMDEEDIGEQENSKLDGSGDETKWRKTHKSRRVDDITGHYRQITYPAVDSIERVQIRHDGKSARLYVAGNHDVGFGDTLVRKAMKRYKGDFGSVNYEIKIGNHSLVVLDTLSLSSNITSIREESQDFLARPETTPCGEARESRQLILDRNGEQYQNMVNASLSQEILRKIQPDMVFSGDDHDWCEMGHSLDGRLIPEVTLPTFSFAQGVAQTGFVVLSLYNPQHISRNARSLTQEDKSAAATMPATALDSHTAKVSDMTTFALSVLVAQAKSTLQLGFSICEE
ncbi:hypothetical protein BGZ96_005462 [Linnemannia gamsii]|uniref:C3H1-type domain-containing protein n=1 Tax=Linnemannia gamsii TaxID=64522 RepID=A0ABQ7K5R2_9FUNG|nr:hypothetical protein BGZ96_005462 [Linnemannia gamsii]